MDTRAAHTAGLWKHPWRVIFLLVPFLLLVAASSFAQNSRGDKPAKQSPVRFPKVKRHTKGADKANTRDISGRRKVRTKNKSSETHITYSNKDTRAKINGTKGGDHAAVPRFKVKVRSISAQRARHNVFPQKGPYVNNSAKKPTDKPHRYTKSASGEPIIRNIPRENQRAWRGNLKGGPIGSGSASRSFVTRGRKDVYWGKFSKGERPITKDLTGRNVRTKNFHSLSPGVGVSDTGKNVLRRPSMEGSNFGKIRGGYASISGGGRAWTNDISGHKLRRRLAQQGKRGRGIFAGFRSASGKGRNNNPIPVRRPGIGANALSRMLRRQGGGSPRGGTGAAGIGNFRGDLTREDLLPPFGKQGLGYSGGIKTKRPISGGGSVSGKVFNNGGNALQGRPPASFGIGSYKGNLLREDVSTKGYGRDGGGFSGNIKRQRQSKGGGSVSGKVFNNNGRSLQVRPPGEGSWAMGSFRGTISKEELEPQLDRGLTKYSGDIRRSRPLKGGGSVSGKVFNNKGRSLQVRTPGRGSWAIGSFRGTISKDELEPRLDRRLSRFSGDIRGGRPLKGGGSISGKVYNNNGNAIAVRPPGRGSWPIYGYSGKLKAYKPLKGGGSISGRYLSNDGNPVRVRPPGRDSWGIPGFQGNIKTHKPAKGGGSISGQSWNNNEKPITVRGPLNDDINSYSGKIPFSRFKKMYVRNPHSVTEALKKRKPDPTTFSIGGLTTKTAQREYTRNPSSNAGALKTWSPGVAYARIKDYQGNLKMSKLDNSRLHPDAQFAHGNRDNVKGERSITTNIKLLWAKIFKRNGGQPDIVKEKQLVPRYDKKEKDLWKALYD